MHRHNTGCLFVPKQHTALCHEYPPALAFSAIEAFSEDNTSYDITVESDVTKIKIEATKKDSKSSISGDIGEKKVDYG